MVEFARAVIALYRPPEHEGQGLVEYGLVIVLIAIAVMTILALLGTRIGGLYSDIAASLR